MLIGGLKLIQGRMEMTRTQKIVLLIVAIILSGPFVGAWDWEGVFILSALVVWLGFYFMWARRLIETAILDFLANRGYVLSGKNHYYLGYLLFILWIGSFIGLWRWIYINYF